MLGGGAMNPNDAMIWKKEFKFQEVSSFLQAILHCSKKTQKNKMWYMLP